MGFFKEISIYTKDLEGYLEEKFSTYPTDVFFNVEHDHNEIFKVVIDTYDYEGKPILETWFVKSSDYKEIDTYCTSLLDRMDK